MIRALFAGIVLLSANPAQAHKLKLFVTAEGAELVGTAYFAGGGKAAGLEGRVLGPAGELARFRTDAEGNFRVATPAEATVIVDGGDGHAASVSLEGTSEAQPESPAMSDVEAAVARQIRPLRLQIDAMEERARFSDIMAGIGTIFGIFGIAAWLAARRGNRQ